MVQRCIQPPSLSMSPPLAPTAGAAPSISTRGRLLPLRRAAAAARCSAAAAAAAARSSRRFSL